MAGLMKFIRFYSNEIKPESLKAYQDILKPKGNETLCVQTTNRTGITTEYALTKLSVLLSTWCTFVYELTFKNMVFLQVLFTKYYSKSA